MAVISSLAVFSYKITSLKRHELLA